MGMGYVGRRYALNRNVKAQNAIVMKVLLEISAKQQVISSYLISITYMAMQYKKSLYNK